LTLTADTLSKNVGEQQTQRRGKVGQAKASFVAANTVLTTSL
jgi:hypothetical protein